VLHDVAHALVGLRREQLAKRDHAQEVLLLVEHVHVVDGFEPLARLLAQVADRLVRGHVRAQTGVARVHQAARLVLGVGEQRVDLLARRLVEQREQRAALLGRRLLQQVDRVVGRQQA
jgi:hypothetical protein